MPYHNINPPICTSTPVIGDVNASPVKGKRKRHVIENDNVEDAIPFIEEGLVGNEKIKKKKKKKKTKHEGCTNKELLILNNEDHLNEKSCCNTIQNDTAKRKKQMKPQNIFPDLKNEQLKGATETNLNISVKEKVSYFEGQSNANELKNTSEVCKIADKIETTTQEEFVNKDQSEDQPNSVDHFRKKKLFVRKRSDFISYDLPKKSNIVPSILVSQNSATHEMASTVAKTIEKVDQTKCLDIQSKTILNSTPATPAKEKLKYSICILTKENPAVPVEKMDCQSKLNEKLETHNEIDSNKRKGKISLFKNAIDDNLHRATEKGRMKCQDLKLENITHKERKGNKDTDFSNSNKIHCDSLNVTKVKEIKQFSKSVEDDMNVRSFVKDSLNELSGGSSKSTGNDFHSMDVKSFEHTSVNDPTENDFCSMDVAPLVENSVNEFRGHSSKHTGNNFSNVDKTSLYTSVNTENDFCSMDVTPLVKDSVEEFAITSFSEPVGNDFNKMDVTSLVTDYECENTKKNNNSFSKITETDFATLETTSPVRDFGMENAKNASKRSAQLAENTFTDMDVTTLVSDSANENLNKIGSSKLTENDSAISLENNLCQPITPMETISICSEKEQSLFSESISSTASENVQPVKATSFITKRKRKRSHRKRKTRSSTETIALPQNNSAEYTKQHIQPTVQPKIHIKFDEDYELIPVNEAECDILEKQLSNVTHTKNIANKNRKTDTQDVIIADNNFILKNERERATNKKCSEMNRPDEIGDCITILDESSEFGPTLISEETISKSVLMVSMKPKCDDIIAFKVIPRDCNNIFLIFIYIYFADFATNRKLYTRSIKVYYWENSAG